MWSKTQPGSPRPGCVASRESCAATRPVGPDRYAARTGWDGVRRTPRPDGPEVDVDEQPVGTGRDRREGRFPTAAPMRLVEQAQDVVTVIVGIALVVLAVTLLVAGVVDFFKAITGTTPVVRASSDLLDQVLLVLILVEVVHTVVLSLRAHTLLPQPFIVVGLVAVIRKILFILGNSTAINTAQLALLVAMVAVFVASLIAVTRFTRDSDWVAPGDS